MSSVFLLLTIFLSSCNNEENHFESEKESIKKINNELGTNLNIQQSVKKENSINFHSEVELKKFILEFKSALKNQNIQFKKENRLFIPTENSHYKLSTSGPCDEYNGIVSVEGLSTGLSTLTYHINIEDGNVKDVNGNMSGFNFPLSYVSNGFNQSQDTNSIIINTSGHVDVNLFWEGVGVIYSENVNYMINVPCSGGGSGVKIYYKSEDPDVDDESIKID